MIHPSHITAYRLLRRLMLLTLQKLPGDNPGQSLPEYVTWFIEQPEGTNGGRRLGQLVRAFSEEKRSLELYSPQEMEAVCKRIVQRLDSLESDGKAEEAEG